MCPPAFLCQAPHFLSLNLEIWILPLKKSNWYISFFMWCNPGQNVRLCLYWPLATPSGLGNHSIPLTKYHKHFHFNGKQRFSFHSFVDYCIYIQYSVKIQCPQYFSKYQLSAFQCCTCSPREGRPSQVPQLTCFCGLGNLTRCDLAHIVTMTMGGGRIGQTSKNIGIFASWERLATNTR